MVTEFVVKVVSTPHAPHSQPKKWSQCGVRCAHTTLHQLSGATPKIVKKVVCFPPLVVHLPVFFSTLDHRDGDVITLGQKSVNFWLKLGPKN